jgi:hypothetical protein
MGIDRILKMTKKMVEQMPKTWAIWNPLPLM